jgi:hypothetical protein
MQSYSSRDFIATPPRPIPLVRSEGNHIDAIAGLELCRSETGTWQERENGGASTLPSHSVAHEASRIEFPASNFVTLVNRARQINKCRKTGHVQ